MNAYTTSYILQAKELGEEISQITLILLSLNEDVKKDKRGDYDLYNR